MRFDEISYASIVRSHIERAARLGARWSKKPRVQKKLFSILLFIIFFGFLLYALYLMPPVGFPTAALVKISEGQTLGAIATQLKEGRVIRSEVLFKAAIVLFGGDRSIIAGPYFFPRAQNVFVIAWRLTTADYEIESARVTIPEGANAREIADILEARLLGFNREAFFKIAQAKEGYLFPDTYFFLPGEEPGVIVKTLQNNFTKHVAGVNDEIEAFGKPLSDIIIMASLLEEEAPDLEDRRIIAGILWERIKQGMRLQVDAVFPYIIGKNSFQLTREDLQTESPYNTYTNKGLPPGPITNPGLDAILAAVTPTKTKYVYYLSDHDGNFHYSVTYEQHLQAKTKYLGT